MKTTTLETLRDYTGVKIDLSKYINIDIEDGQRLDELNISKADLRGKDGINVIGTWLEEMLVNERPDKLKQVEIPFIEWERDEERKYTGKVAPTRRPISGHRLARFLENSIARYGSTVPIPLNDGTDTTALITRKYNKLVGDPVIYLEFAEEDEEGKNKIKMAIHNKCKEWIDEGLKYRGNMYEYCMSSSSQMRQIKGIFVRMDYALPEHWIAKFADERYKDFLRSLRGAECILEAMTYGAWSHTFTSRWAKWIAEPGEFVADIEQTPSKVSTRAGASLTSSIVLGRDLKIKTIGKVLYKWTEMMEEYCRSVGYNEKEIETLKRVWKEDKLDGQNMMTDRVFAKLLKNAGIPYKFEELAGTLVQYRWAGDKGTALVVRQKFFKQNPIYKNYDMVVESNSRKYHPAPFYVGDLAPEFEMVSYSKSKHSNSMNYQFWNCLDGAGNRPDTIAKVAKEVFSELLEGIQKAMTDPVYAMTLVGMSQGSSSRLEEAGIDEFKLTQRSKLTKALATRGDVVKDRWFRGKLIDLFKNTSKECSLGKIPVKGANRFIISDPIAMFRTDLMNEKGDIIITDPSQVGLKGPEDCFWAKKECEAVLFRSPSISPGEPQKVHLTNNINETVSTAFGDLDVKTIFDDMKHLVVISGFSFILDALGGADTDGDTCLCVTDPRIVALRYDKRKTLVVEAPSETRNSVMSVRAMKDNMIASLKNNGVGLITDYSTTFRDIQLHVIATKDDWKEGMAPVVNDFKKLKGIAKDAISDGDNTNVAFSIANMDLNDWKSVYKTLNTVLNQLRFLQEMSINTAKSGKFVDFKEFPYLNISCRAAWHKSRSKSTFTSKSPMSQLSAYVKEEWTSLYDWAMDTAETMPLDYQFDNYEEIYKAVDSLKAEYGKKVHQLKLKKLPKEKFNDAFEDIVNDINMQLNYLSVRYGTDAVAITAYVTSNKEQKKSAEGTSFVWNCLFEDFMDTLQFLNKQEGLYTDRLFKVALNQTHAYSKFDEMVMTVEDSSVCVDETIIGRSSIEDGSYVACTIGESLYIRKKTIAPTVDKLNNTLKGKDFVVIGFQHYEDKIGGGCMTRDKAEAYLNSEAVANEVYLYRGRAKSEDTASRLYALIPCATTGKYIPIGIIPDGDRGRTALNKVLVSKKVKAVVSSRDKGQSSRIVLTIDEVLEDTAK